MKKSNLDVYLLLPIKNFIEKKTSVGVSLIISSLLALLLANSPLKGFYHDFWQQEIYIGFNDFVINKSLHHWINDGLMSMFFFIVGLELKREILYGELSSLRKASLPVFAAIGGMLVPAFIYMLFNFGTDSASGWGIPMATDIAFALGILYLLGDQVPVSLKIFLTAIAIADDMGAVLVIAFFYTEQISIQSLGIGLFFLLILLLANFSGIRNMLFYGIMGIGGLWLATMLSGIHETIAAVLAAFAIPTTKRINTAIFLRKAKFMSNRIKNLMKRPFLTIQKNQEEISHTVEKFSLLAQDATPPLQRIEHSLQPFVSFVVLPLFAFANAGVSFNSDSFSYFLKPVSLGIILGLILGKFLGIVLFTKLMVKLGIAELPKNVQWKHIYGVGLLGAIGFTMSLFITELAFSSEIYLNQAKIGVFSGSLLAGVIGYFYLKYINRSIEN
ncbi:sodium/proton antiporter NhaA [Pontixanthobacter gangjinensis]|uniref:Na(+)/H(+) antiporter NhaA n=1 Tax=Christiangramia aestuarii TaxID=1028746 RepID=A0A7K1LQZ8_9FLAO|nr:Na+/H+ antiporter NhaA [Christiangramia aestuarii]MUP43041.1 Na+/H+ antiporter NhaA [Christiangramia aestuarii]